MLPRGDRDISPSRLGSLRRYMLSMELLAGVFIVLGLFARRKIVCWQMKERQ